MSEATVEKTSFGRRILAVLILGVAAWILLKFAIGLVTAVASTVAVIAALVAIIWAIRTL